MAKSKEDKTTTIPEGESPRCGIVMPISGGGNEVYTEEHWGKIFKIIQEAADKSGFKSDMVSRELHTGIIHENIVRNLYSNEVIVVDVSGKNPNVMLELGMRLAFDLPTIIIKDELTDYTFDAGLFEHIPYTSNLEYESVVNLIDKLADKIRNTHQYHIKHPKESVFVGKFIKDYVKEDFAPEKVEQLDLILEHTTSIRRDIKNIQSQSMLGMSTNAFRNSSKTAFIDPATITSKELDALEKETRSSKGIRNLSDSTMLALTALMMTISPEMEKVKKCVIDNFVTLCAGGADDVRTFIKQATGTDTKGEMWNALFKELELPQFK
ncbi:MAG: hypothetical protein AB8F78_05065 [Saprospiraceae bacterium]